MCEDAPCCGCCGPQGDGDYYGREDDLADYNDREAEDYADEDGQGDEEGHEGEDDERDGYYGNEDSHLDGMGEE